HKSQFRVAGHDELEGLGDVVTLDDFLAQPLVEAKRLHGFDRRRSVGGRHRIGDGNSVEFSPAQGRLAARQIEVRAEEHEFAGRIGEYAVFQSQARGYRLSGRLLIRRQQYLEGSLLGYLGVQLTGGAKTQN